MLHNSLFVPGTGFRFSSLPPGNEAFAQSTDGLQTRSESSTSDHVQLRRLPDSIASNVGGRSVRINHVADLVVPSTVSHLVTEFVSNAQLIEDALLVSSPIRSASPPSQQLSSLRLGTKHSVSSRTHRHPQKGSTVLQPPSATQPLPPTFLHSSQQQLQQPSRDDSALPPPITFSSLFLGGSPSTIAAANNQLSTMKPSNRKPISKSGEETISPTQYVSFRAVRTTNSHVQHQRITARQPRSRPPRTYIQTSTAGEIDPLNASPYAGESFEFASYSAVELSKHSTPLHQALNNSNTSPSMSATNSPAAGGVAGSEFHSDLPPNLDRKSTDFESIPKHQRAPSTNRATSLFTTATSHISATANHSNNNPSLHSSTSTVFSLASAVPLPSDELISMPSHLLRMLGQPATDASIATCVLRSMTPMSEQSLQAASRNGQGLRARVLSLSLYLLSLYPLPLSYP